MACALIAIGSNLGDRADHLRAARREIDALPDTRVAAASAVYETAPVGPGDQGPYLNAALRVETALPPRELLERLLAIEEGRGRDREGERPWGPRTLDLDVLVYDDRLMEGPALVLPHPRMHERAFVLRPVCDVAAEVAHPRRGRSMAELLADVDEAGVERLRSFEW